VVHSYLAHPLRPRWCTAKLRELFSVSQWMLVQNIGGYLDNNLHKLLVGRRDDTATMGAYSVAADVAAMPSTELLQPVNRVLFPAFVAVKHDLDELKRTFLLALGLQTMIALPAAAFMAILADVLVPVLLGDRWGRARGMSASRSEGRSSARRWPGYRWLPSSSW
jgi:O-antigen/teichoic acid export membrane protein